MIFFFPPSKSFPAVWFSIASHSFNLPLLIRNDKTSPCRSPMERSIGGIMLRCAHRYVLSRRARQFISEARFGEAWNAVSVAPSCVADKQTRFLRTAERFASGHARARSSVMKAFCFPRAQLPLSLSDLPLSAVHDSYDRIRRLPLPIKLVRTFCLTYLRYHTSALLSRI